MSIGLSHYLAVSGLLFALGLAGALLRRNLLIVLMSVEMMVSATSLALVACSRFNGNLDGQVLVFFVIMVAAAEAAVGLALIVALRRQGLRPEVDQLTQMKL